MLCSLNGYGEKVFFVELDMLIVLYYCNAGTTKGTKEPRNSICFSEIFW